MNFRRVGRWALTIAAHPLTVRAERGASLQRPARVRGRLELARGAEVLRGLDCVGPVRVGSGSFVNAYAYLRPGVVIGSEVAIGSHVRLITDSHDLNGPRRRAGQSTCRPIVIEDGAWLGANVTVLPGVTIGAGAVVGAGSTVTSDVPPHTVVTGPAAVARRSLTDRT